MRRSSRRRSGRSGPPARPLGPVLLVVILLLLVAGLWYLSTVDTERPLTRIEKTIPNDRLGK